MASSNDDVHAVCLQVLPNLDSDIFEYIVGLLEDYDAPSSNYDDDDDVLQSTIAEFLVEAEYCHDEAKAKDTASELLLRIRALKSQDPSAPTTAATATTATKSTPGIGVLPIQSDGCVAQATRKAAALSIKAVPPSPQPQTETRSSLTPDASSNTKNNDTDNAVVAVATMPISSSSSNNGSTSTTSSISKVESARESRKTAGKKKDRTNNNKAADRRIVQEALEMEAALYDARVAAIHARTVQGTYKGTLDLSPSFTLPNPGGGIPLLEDATGTLVSGRIYGLIGRNGTGKSTLLRALASRSVGNIPPNVVVHYVSQEVNLTQEQRVQKRPVDCVLEADLERTLLLQELSSLEQDAEAGRLDGPGSARHALVLSRLDEIGSDSAERRATELLSNLGFTSELQSRNLEQLSGGWRVRTMLAAAIFSKPDVLLLDEPTNHLSIRAVLWLTRELATNETWKSRIVMIVSHDRHFMDEVCTDCLHISGAAKRLTQSRGNYSQWAFQRREQQALFAKTQTGRQEEIDKLREYAGHGFKYGGSASQINKMGMKSKQADKLEEEQTQQAQELAALVEDLELPMTIGSGGELDGFVVQLRNVGFGYPNSSPSLLFKHCEIGITSKSRIVLLGENGNGKTTLLKLIVGELEPSEGDVRRSPHARFAKVDQHHADQIDLSLTPLQFMAQQYPGNGSNEHMQILRGHLSSCGVTSGSSNNKLVMDLQNTPSSALSGGQRSRVALASVSFSKPHVLILDEPTNNLDLESVEALAKSVQSFKGAVICVSHDQYFVQAVANEAWVVSGGAVKQVASFESYRNRQMQLLAKSH